MTKVSWSFYEKKSVRKKSYETLGKSLMKDSPEGITKSLSSMLCPWKKAEALRQMLMAEEWKEISLLLPWGVIGTWTQATIAQQLGISLSFKEHSMSI